MLKISLFFMILCLSTRAKSQTTSESLEILGAEDINSSGDAGITLETMTGDVTSTPEIVGDASSEFNSTTTTATDDQNDFGTGVIDLSNVDESSNETETTSIPTTTTTDATTSTTTTAPTTTTSAPTTTQTTTTTEPSTTTETTSTTLRTTTTTTARPTTVKLTTTTRQPHPKTTLTPTSSEKTTDVTDLEAKQCIFMEEFSCDVDITCFGEGTIDCTETEEDEFPDEFAGEENPPEEEKAPPSEEDYEEEEIQTYPPELVGRVPPKISLPRRTDTLSKDAIEASITTTPSTEGTSTSTTDETTVYPSTMNPTIIILDGTSDSTTDMVEVETSSTIPEVEKTTPAAIDSEISTTQASNSTNEVDESLYDETKNYNDTTSTSMHDDNVTGMRTEIFELTSTTVSTTELLQRKKRDEPLSSMSGSSLHVASVEGGKQKIRVRECRIRGNLKCTPVPTIGMCKGKTTCQVSDAAQKSEKSTSSKGVETWAIAVIAICAIAAALTLSLLIYLIITSWKKLKVQPQNGVTTLTYVNNTPA